MGERGGEGGRERAQSTSTYYVKAGSWLLLLRGRWEDRWKEKVASLSSVLLHHLPSTNYPPIIASYTLMPFSRDSPTLSLIFEPLGGRRDTFCVLVGSVGGGGRV